MRGRRRGASGTAADFLVCFPPRAHLALMPPKTTCSPSRPSASSERRHSTSGRPSLSGSNLSRAAAASRSRRLAAVDVGVDNEPSSPKVGCAGQIKVSRSAKPKAGAGEKAPKKATTWMQALGIKKDALPFLNAFHGAFRLNVSGCFGRFPGAVVEYSSSGEEDEEDDEQVAERAGKGTEHGDALTKWFMVLEEGKRVPRKKPQEQEQPQDEEEDVAPPANALMLMRCRSAPAKGLARRLGGGDAGDDGEAKKAGEEEEVEKENLVVMRYPPDFFQVSVDIAKETWIVGGDDSILRCRSWKK